MSAAQAFAALAGVEALAIGALLLRLARLAPARAAIDEPGLFGDLPALHDLRGGPPGRA